jgi:hypothetical protein
MADLRVLKLALLAETKDFVAGLNDAEASSKTFGDKLGGALKKSALAFAAVGAAAGAMAIKIGKDAVAAAIEDQQSQEQLAIALRNTVGATEEQIKATEDYITATQNRYGVEDTKLRSSLAALTRSTGDVTKAQELQNLALDIAASTGKDLESVSLTLSKAYNGNIGALTKLGIPLDENIIKTGDFAAATEALTDLFGGAAQAQADTYAGRMEIIKRRVEDAQEAVGFALLPFLEKLSGFVGDVLVPIIEKLSAGFVELAGRLEGDFGGTIQKIKKIVEPVFKGLTSAFNSIREAIIRNEEKLKPLFELMKALGSFIATFIIPIALKGLGLGFTILGKTIAGVIDFVAFLIDIISKAVGVIQGFLSGIQKAIDTVTRLISLLPRINVGVPSVAGGGGGTTINNINVKGAIDTEGTARTIAKTVNKSKKKTGNK